MRKKTVLLLSIGLLVLSSCGANSLSETSKSITSDTTSTTKGDIEDSSTSSTTTTNTTTSTSSTTTTSTTTTVTNQDDPDKVKYTISLYNYDDKSLIKEVVVEDGATIDDIEQINKIGYTFNGWSYRSNTIKILPSGYKFSQDLSLYATYNEINYSVSSIMQYTAELNETSLYGKNYTDSRSEYSSLFNAGGFVEGKFDDFSKYENTSSYVKVSTADELINALSNAKLEYSTTITSVDEADKIVRQNVRKNETNWINAITKGLYLKKSDGSYFKIPEDTPYSDTTYTVDMTYYEDSNYADVTFTQTLTKESTVHVIEIENDIDLGYKLLSDTAKSSGLVDDFASKTPADITMSSMYNESGMSQIKISNTNDLLIYSKNGAKLTHGGFKVNSCDRVAFRNLEMDEMWQWEDSASETPNETIGDMDAFGWAYFKINYCGYIWIDHCTFGKSYDGQIDIANPYFYSVATASSAPYGKPSTYTENESSGVHISNCCFNAGSDDKDGYLYKMMQEIEVDYQKTLSDPTYETKYRYYKTLRDGFSYDTTSNGTTTTTTVEGLSFDEILYGIAIPQKKAFLCGDSGDYYDYNLKLKVSFENDYFKNIEDRLPNVRGGFAYMYNSIIDNREYYQYRTTLRSKGVVSIKNYNSKYKCGMVSQGIIGGYGASIRTEGCVFLGIYELFKNNNSNSNYTSEQLAAGYSMVNCIYSLTGEDTSTSLSIQNTDINPNTSNTQMSTANFDWHTESGEAPFIPTIQEPGTLMQYLFGNMHIGTNEYIFDMYTYVKL